MSVYRVYVAKKAGFDVEAKGIFNMLMADNLSTLSHLSILNRYDIEFNDPSLTLEAIASSILSEPLLDDIIYNSFDLSSYGYFTVEYLPGQFDQRADSAMRCIQVAFNKDNLKVRCAKTYLFNKDISNEDLEKVKKYLINPVDQRIASEDIPASLAMPELSIKEEEEVHGFNLLKKGGLKKLIESYSLCLSIDDMLVIQKYFQKEGRDPFELELKLLDTYWSDHCRHTTFNTHLSKVRIAEGRYNKLFSDTFKVYKSLRKAVYGEDAKKKPITLMDMATIMAKYLKKEGILNNVEDSEENNACSIEINAKINGQDEPYLIQFKNETHNHPTEIEPFGGAATCVGGAIRDPLAGRAYVYQSMRVSGAASPDNLSADESIPQHILDKKLPQKKICLDSAKGFSSYGNQIGIATGMVREFYHPAFFAKRLEAGAVVGAVPKKAVLRLAPTAGDIIFLIGGRTGRDGIGGATGSSKAHSSESVDISASEVQKGNPVEEHKIQRLFRKPSVSKLIKRCNDFGAGGVCVAIGELASGIKVNLNNVSKKYAGLSASEIALSESQERMAVLIAPSDKEAFLKECALENIEASLVATVTDNNRLQLEYDGKLIADIERELLDSAGALRKQDILVEDPFEFDYVFERAQSTSLTSLIDEALVDINVASQKGLVEMFDSTIGRGTVLMPYAGKYSRTPCQAMVAKIPTLLGDTSTCTIMSCGYFPEAVNWSPFHGAYSAVMSSVANLIVAGARLQDIRLSFQEYFERLDNESARWGKPFSAMLGALRAQYDLSLAAIGGKDSMSGSFVVDDKRYDVPPTLISFAIAPSDIKHIISPELKEHGGDIYLLKTPFKEGYILDEEAFKTNCELIFHLINSKIVLAAYAVSTNGIIEALCKMAFGNMVGFDIEDIELDKLFFPYFGSFLVQIRRDTDVSYFNNIELIAKLNSKQVVTLSGDRMELNHIYHLWQDLLADIYPIEHNISWNSSAENIYGISDTNMTLPKRDYSHKSFALISGGVKAKPQVAMICLPGTNCEYDMKLAFERAGSREVSPFIFRNLSLDEVEASCDEIAELINSSQILAIPGGFSMGDEPDGSAKFFLSVFKHRRVRDAINNLLNKRDGLAIGICNGFQALLKSGLLTEGHILDSYNKATLAHNTIGRHISQLVSTRVSSLNSPWVAKRNLGEVDIVPVSHGEGRFIASEEVFSELFNNGQVLFQYVDLDSNITMQSPYNPNGSMWAIEGICSPNGRALGKMGHSERYSPGLFISNSYGNFDQKIFEAGVEYFL